MKERGIPFTGPMVQAILDGRKSMTRRLVKGADGVIEMRQHLAACTAVYSGGGNATFYAPYQPGDRLWVREAWRTGAKLDDSSGKKIQERADEAGYNSGPRCPLKYEADGYATTWGDNDRYDFGDWGRYRHARFMPRWASRITLEVTGVRCERLNDISEEDAEAEGAMPCPPDYEGECLVAELFRPYACGFAQLWESIHGEGSWAENPWLWVYEFRPARIQ